VLGPIRVLLLRRPRRVLLPPPYSTLLRLSSLRSGCDAPACELGVVRVRESELPHAAGIGLGVDVLELDLIATLAADLGPQIVHVGVYRP
jgi:hypothetical protein